MEKFVIRKISGVEFEQESRICCLMFEGALGLPSCRNERWFYICVREEDFEDIDFI